MPAVSRVAVVGAGVAGLAAAILLAEAEIEVDVFESKEGLSALGSGITLQGNALRAFERLGIWERVQERSFAFDVLGLRAPGPEATAISHHATKMVPKYSPTPVTRWAIDIIIGNGQR